MIAPAVAAARSWIGTPYMHQASVRGVGADCLGLVRGIWREIYGAEPEQPPAYTPDWGEAGADELLNKAALRHMAAIEPETPFCAGELLLFRMRGGAVAKHLGILSNAGPAAAFIHAYDRYGVVESPFSGPWQTRVAGRFRFPAL